MRKPVSSPLTDVPFQHPIIEGRHNCTPCPWRAGQSLQDQMTGPVQFQFSFLVLASIAGFCFAQLQGNVVTVCTNPWHPLVQCDGDKLFGLDLVQFDLIAETRELNYIKLGNGTEPQSTSKTYYRYECMPIKDVLSNITSPDGICDIVTSLSVTSERIEAGMIFSYPLERDGLSVLTKANFQTVNGWGFVKPFVLGVWFLVLTSCLVVVPVLVFVFETLHQHGTLLIGFKPALSELSNSAWYSLASLMRFGHSAENLGKSLGARFVLAGYGYSVLILMSLYVANLTANLTALRIKTNLASPADLSGKNIYTLRIFEHRLEEHGVKTIGTVASKDNLKESFDSLKNETIDGLIMQSDWVSYVMTLNGCERDLHSFPMPIQPLDAALAFHVNTTSEFRTKVNNAIQRLVENGELAEVTQNFLSKEGQCLRGGNYKRTAIEIRDVYGVWIILLSCIVVAAAIAATYQCLRRRKGGFEAFQDTELNLSSLEKELRALRATCQSAQRSTNRMMEDVQRLMVPNRGATVTSQPTEREPQPPPASSHVIDLVKLSDSAKEQP